MICFIFGHSWSAWPNLRGPCARCGKEVTRMGGKPSQGTKPDKRLKKPKKKPFGGKRATPFKKR